MRDEEGQSLDQLDDIFEKSTEAQPETKVESEEKGEIAAVPPTAPKEPANEAEDESQKLVPLAALKDERQKRQALETELANVRAEKPKQVEQERIDLFADPDRYQDSIESKINQSQITTKITLSRDFFSELKPDYAEKEARFIKMAEENPTLAGLMAQSPNPARFAYETAAKQMAIDEIATDPSAYEEKIRQKVLAELNQTTQSTKQPINRAPSLATATGIKDSPLTVSDLDDIMAGSAL